MESVKTNTIEQLRRQILELEGYKPASSSFRVPGLCAVEAAFPYGVLPLGAVHEFLSDTIEERAATKGFVSALAGKILAQGAVCIWICSSRRLYAPGLRSFGVSPERMLVVRVSSDRQLLWATEEALKCQGLGLVIAEVRDLDFMASRRLQLATEHSGVTGFMLRHQSRNHNTNTTVARWRIRPAASGIEAGLPGIGFPKWNVELEKVKNGKGGSWQLQWTDDSFEITSDIRRLPDTALRAQAG